VRRAPRAGEDALRWDPSSGAITPTALALDAVVHLAGESIMGLRWTAEKKRRIRESRTTATRLLVQTLVRLPKPPGVLISASAIGYYGNRGDEVLTEDSGPGTGFLADVARDWEAATAAAIAHGIRVVNPRLGVVLSDHGGALAKMLTPFRLGMGGVVGDGTQWMSWIALDDVVGAIQHALATDSLRGPVNAVARARDQRRAHAHARTRAPAPDCRASAGVRGTAGYGRDGRRALAGEPACAARSPSSKRVRLPSAESRGRAPRYRAASWSQPISVPMSSGDAARSPGRSAK
jgi:uncharacterized protein (TIGR01777 family)